MKKHTFFIKMLSVLLALLLTVFVVPATVYADVINMVTDAISSTSSDAPVPETSPSDADSLLTRVGEDVFEDIDLREENVKHFRLADGSYSAYLYDMPVHILDENGKWQDINNTLEEQNQEYATPDARIKFAKKITGNQTIFTLHEGNHKVTLSLDGAIKKTTGRAINTVTEFDESATLLQKLTTLDRLTSRVVYENILDGVDIEYVIESRNIKENIIVKESKDSYSYTFTLALNNLSATLADDGLVILSDSESNDAIYTIPAPNATDADGNNAPIDKVYYSLTNLGNHTYSLTVTADADWMNHADRAFPVTIDPPVYVAGESNVIDTNISTAKPDVTDAAGDSHNWVSSTGSYQTYWRAYTLPDLPSSARLVNATYYASFWYPSSTSGKIGVYPVTTDWNDELNWEKAHTGTTPQGDVGDRCYDYVDISYTYNENDKYESFSLDLTALVKAWYEEEMPNYGICLKVLEDTTYTGTAQIVSNDFVFEKDEQSDNSDENDNPDKSAHKPQLVISYRFIDGIESYWSTLSQSAGNAGTGNVNLCLGYLNHTFYGPTTTDGLLPYTFTLHYNSNDSLSNHSLFGHMWTADFEQEIIPQLSPEITAGVIPQHYIWKDPDGTKHVFSYTHPESNGFSYVDEDGLGLRLDILNSVPTDLNEPQYTMTTLYDEAYHFNKNGYLIRHEDAWGNARIFHRTTINTVDYIALLPSGEDTEIRQVNISYNESTNATSITYVGSGKQLRFYYGDSYGFPPYTSESEGTLYKIEYHASTSSTTPFATVEFEYIPRSSHIKLADVYDSFSKTGIEYNWNNYKVTNVRGYSWTIEGTAIGAQTEILYNPNGEDKTVCRTRGNDDILSVYDNESDDLLTHYFFDDYGRTTGTYVTNASEEIIYGTSRTQYTETSQESPQANNRVSHQAVSGQIPINLIKNGSFLSSVSNWSSSNANVSLYSDDNYEKALSLKAAASGTARVYQTVTLKPGTYTFSANLRLSSVSGQGKARLTVTNTSYSVIASSDYLNAPAAVANIGGYVPMSVTFTVSSQTTCRVGMELTTTRTSDTLYTDDIALGKSSAPSAVSILVDGSFDTSSGVWYGQNITPSFGNYQFYDDTRSLAINNTTATDAYVYQTLTLLTNEERTAYVSNSASYSGAAQAYLLSGYAKAASPSAKSDRVFALRAQVIYLTPTGTLTDEWIDIPFDPYCNEWQFTSGSFTTDPQKGCPYQIKIACSYKNNVGFAYFDNIVLTKSFDSIDYAYNSHGSVARSVNSGSGTSVEYEYDDNGIDVTKETHSNGIVIERTYQNHKVVDEIVYGDTVALPDTYNSYNSYGQLESSLSYGEEAYAMTDYVYSTETASWGKLDTEITPLGETVYIYSDSPFDYGLLLAVLDENGTGSFYTYDALGRQIQVEPFVNYNFVSNGESVTNEYSGSELVSIETASTEYAFTYNDFGVNNSISVGTNKIVRYLYNSYNGKLRYVVYANGYIERYDYDTLDRLTSIWYYENGSITASETTIKGYSYNQLCEYVYDGEGNLVEYIDKVTSVRERYRYQADGKLASTCHYTLNGTTMVLSDVVVYTYDANHNPSGSRYATLLNGTKYTRTTAVSYDSLNRVTGFSDNGVTSGYTYHLLGMTASASLSRGNTLIQYAYTYKTTPDPFFDGFERQTGLPESVTSTLKQGSTTRESNTFAYTYDDRDNITEIRIDGVLKYSYEYDYLDQLIRENNKVSNKTYLYTYDNAGNLLSKQVFPYNSLVTSQLVSAPAEATYTYTYENANWGDRLSSYRDVPFAYDSLGNPIHYYNGASYTFTWQNGRQLEKVTKGNTTYTFTYDAEGRRTSKQWSIGRDIQYLWDGDLLIGEYVVGQETITYSYDASGSPVGFTYTDLTGYYEGGVPCNFLYRKNPQGDIIGIVDWSGNEFVKYNYDAWGNLISYTMHGDGLYSLHYNMAEGNSFRYRGYYFDRETGFYYLKSRYYDPKIGRFLNADDSISTGSGLLGYNMYAYANNNSIGIAYNSLSVVRNTNDASRMVSTIGVSNHFIGTSNSNTPPKGKLNLDRLANGIDTASTIHGLYTSISGLVNHTAYFAKNLTPFSDDMAMIGASMKDGVLSFNQFTWKLGKGDAIGIGLGVVLDIYDSYQRGVSPGGTFLGATLTATKSVGLIYLNKGIMYGATAFGSCFGPVGTAIGFVVGGVVCIVADVHVSDWFGDLIDKIAK